MITRIETVFVTKIAITLLLSSSVFVALPGFAVLVAPLTWVLIGRWWNVIYVLGWISLLARLPYYPTLLKDTWIGSYELSTTTLLWMGGEAAPNWFIDVVLWLGNSELKVVLLLFGLVWLGEYAAIRQVGPYLERRAARILGYKPRAI